MCVGGERESDREWVMERDRVKEIVRGGRRDEMMTWHLTPPGKAEIPLALSSSVLPSEGERVRKRERERKGEGERRAKISIFSLFHSFSTSQTRVHAHSHTHTHTPNSQSIVTDSVSLSFLSLSHSLSQTFLIQIAL